MPLEHQVMLFNIAKLGNPNVTFKEAILEKESYKVNLIDFDYEKKLDLINKIPHDRNKIITSDYLELAANSSRRKSKRV